MIGFLIGLVCGAGELFLLTRVIKAVSAGRSLQTVAFVFAKILLFAAALVPVALFFQRELLWCGIGISSVLVVGAVVINVLMRRNGKGDR
ncbi:hypothetical protein SDC9_135840 [bioreactor metagenome]|jgi:hypothetical protein|uniref:Uncharacterized protein n=1 Tax=bioreactor metagenome TaxID=1076179 RepID=A0A645DHE4_9ZZZZ